MITARPVARQLTSALSRPSRVRGPAPRPDDHVIIVFGAAGDLARRKLLPGLFHLAAVGLMPDRYQIIGSSSRSSRETSSQLAARLSR
jgi:glucose-6-phosphate 1-dehydrogenase